MPNNRPLVIIHDLETDSIIEREMTDAEFADYQLKLENFEQSDPEKVLTERELLLAKLGITEDEAKLLLS